MNLFLALHTNLELTPGPLWPLLLSLHLSYTINVYKSYLRFFKLGDIWSEVEMYPCHGAI